MSQVAINLDQDTLAMLDESAAFRSLSREEMLREAINEAAAYDRYYRETVKAGLREADDGKLIPHDIVEREMDNLLQSFENK